MLTRMFSQSMRVLLLGSLFGLGFVVPAPALTLQMKVGDSAVEVEDNGKLDRKATAGTIHYRGKLGDVEIDLTASEEKLPQRRYALTLSGLPNEQGAPNPAFTNLGKATTVKVELRSSTFEALGPRLRSELRYQGQWTDVEDARLDLQVPLNRLVAVIAGNSVLSVEMEPLNSEGEENSFERTAQKQIDSTTTQVDAVLEVGLGTGDALNLDEARLSLSALEGDFPFLPALAGVLSAAVVVGLFLVLRPRRR